MSNAAEILEEKIPPEKSIGGENGYIVWCDPHMQRRHYGACLWLIDAFNAGRIEPEDPRGDCATEMQAGRCPAMRMRKEELEKGEALYFRPRNKVMTHEPTTEADRRSPSYQRGWNQVSGKKAGEIHTFVAGSKTGKSKIAPAKPEKPQGEEFTNIDYGQVVTQMAAGEKKAPEKQQRGRAVKGITQREFEVLEKKIALVRKSDPEKADRMLARAKELLNRGGSK